MVGGDDEIVERCRPVFATYADPIVHLGPLGSGQVTKILNNLLFTANLGSAISTLELGESLGIDRNRLCEVLNSGSATSKALGSIAAFGGTLDGLAPIAGALLQKDVRHAASLADAASAPQGAVFDAADAALDVDGPPAMTRVGFVGAGRMGAPMVRRLVDAGHDVRALGRTPEKCCSRPRIWAHMPSAISPRSPRAPTPSSSACSPTNRCGRSACEDGLVAAMAPDAVLVVHTTGSPRTAEAIAARGVDVIDAPVSGGPHDIAAGQVTLFVGGDDDAVARTRPLLSSLRRPGPARRPHSVRVSWSS